ncbi:MAG: ATP-binding protein [Pseudomonas sp.]
MNFGLILSLLLFVFFVVTGYWVTYKVFRGELVKADYHFLNFVGRAYDHEVFLLRALNASAAPEYNPIVDAAGQLSSRHASDSSVIYTGQASQYATRFSLVVPASLDSAERVARPLAVGIGLANVYSDFWARSSFLAPQVFLLDPDRQIDIALPSIDRQPSHSIIQGDVVSVLRQVRHVIDKQPTQKSDLFVHWAPAKRYTRAGAEQLLAYTSVPMSPADQGVGDPPRELIVASFMDLFESSEIAVRIEQQVFDALEFDSIDLMAPDGTMLFGTQDSGILAYEDGFHLTASGLLIKRSSGAKLSWQALYRISFERLIVHAKWQLLSLAGLLVVCVLSGWGLGRWYRRRIVVPARSDYSELRINHDFNRSLLQTVPLALCVLKADQLLTCNSLFIDWLGGAQTITGLMKNWPLFDGEWPQVGEGCLLVGTRALHVRYAPTHFQDKHVLLCTFTDITAHREAAATLVLARQLAEAANAEKSRFVATISHEIRTPLYGVLGTLELLGLTALTPQQRVYLDTIDSSSELLLHVISDVLDMSKIESGQMLLEEVEFNPLEMLEALVRGVSDRAVNKGLALYSCVDPDVPLRLVGDGLRLRQIIGNLLSNALKFTDSGQVTVHLTVTARRRDEVQLLWRVVDSGPGIAEEAQRRLFEPFYQTDNQHHSIKGTGLGLSICANLCELMGATLGVKSVLGQGSEFSVALTVGVADAQDALLPASHFAGRQVEVRSPYPELTDSLCAWLEHFGAQTSIIADAQLGPADVVLEVMPEASAGLDREGPTVFARHDFSLVPQSIGKDILVNQHRLPALLQAVSMAIKQEFPDNLEFLATPERRALGLRVLLAEDNPVNQALMQEQLEHIGCTVTLAANGQEALRQLDQQAFELILTDVNMPVMDGYALAEAVRQRDLQVPIIGVTANALREEGEHCMRVGMNSWLSKPISIEGLFLCLDAVTANALAVSRSAAGTVQALGPARDQFQVPERMRALFSQTLRQDLWEIRAAMQHYDPTKVIRLLHRIRSALVVGKARALIVLSKELEAQVNGAEQAAMICALMQFIERVEEALASQGDAPKNVGP